MAKRKDRHTLRWALLAMFLAAVLAVYFVVSAEPEYVGPPCRAVVGEDSFGMTLEQADHAVTIAAVAKRMGMPNRAVTVALATALQESQLRNLDYGDRDSKGLFQQRPSQGWGTDAQVQDPVYASEQFFAHLAEVPGWANMSVNDAAQTVQRSGFPEAYAQWESVARTAAIALTGERPAAFSCHYASIDRSKYDAKNVNRFAQQQLGTDAVNATFDDARGWVAASWLIGQADQFGIDSVQFGGQRWTASSGSWTPEANATNTVTVNAD